MPTRSRERQLRALTRLADGRADERDRAAFRAYAESSPQAARQLDRQRKVVALLHGGGPALPAHVRLQLASLSDTPPIAWRVRAHRALVSGRPVVVLAAICVLLAAIVVGSAWRGSGGRTGPTTNRVAMLTATPTSGARQADRANPAVLLARFAGVTFPDYRSRFGARAWERRTDTIDGRTIETVDYRLGDGRQMGYSVVSGAPLAVGRAARETVVAGVPIRAYVENGLSYVTLVRHGRTCVLSGRLPTATLIALAAAPLPGPRRV